MVSFMFYAFRRKRNKSSGSVSDALKASEISTDSPQRRQPSRTPNFPGLPASSTPAKTPAGATVNFAKAAAGANSTDARYFFIHLFELLCVRLSNI